MKINNKIKRFLTGERGGKASKNIESFGVGTEKLKNTLKETGSKPLQNKINQRKVYTILNVGDKIDPEGVFPEEKNGTSLGWLYWHQKKEDIKRYEILSVSVNRSGKPKYICQCDKGEQYTIKPNPRTALKLL